MIKFQMRFINLSNTNEYFQTRSTYGGKEEKIRKAEGDIGDIGVLSFLRVF